MSKELVISANRHETRVATLEDDQLVEIAIERASEHALAGNIYKGRVSRVLPGMQSAFVKIGLERDAFLYVSDVLDETAELESGAADEEGDEIVADAASPDGGAEEPQENDEGPQRRRRGDRRGRSRGGRGRQRREESSPASEEAEAAPQPEEPQPESAGGSEEESSKRRERRGRRGRRRRGRGGRDSRIPAEKYTRTVDEDTADETPRRHPVSEDETETRVARSSVEPERAEEEDDDFAVLPGESLAKYSGRGYDDEDDIEYDTDEEEPAEDEAVEDVPAAESEQEREEEVESADDEDRDDGDRAEDEPDTQDEGGEEAEDDDSVRSESEDEADDEPSDESDEGDSDDDEPDEDSEDDQADSEDDSEEDSDEEEDGAEEESDGEERSAEQAEVRERGGARNLRRGRRGRRRGGRGRRDSRDREQTAQETQEAEDGSRESRPRRERTPAEPESKPEPSSEHPNIADLLKPGQEVIVQVAKEPLGKKGARITSHVALPGRHLVYMPTVAHVGVSRKIGSDAERARLRRVIKEASEGIPGGFIVRTAGQSASDDELREDIRFLANLWKAIKEKAERRPAPTMLHQDLDVVERFLRDQLGQNFKTIWVDSEDHYESIVGFVERFQPDLLDRVKLYTRSKPIFDEFKITGELEKALRPKVWLKSGGYIVINQTEALVAVDVNTGKYVGKSDRLEDTIVKTNLEAVQEVVRQMRLRDLGGIIVVDFIDMDDRSNRKKVTQALEKELRYDRAPSKALSFNDFGLVAITRKRVKQSLERALCSPCPTCDASGYVKSPTTVILEILNETRNLASKVKEAKDVTLRVNPDVARVLKSRDNTYLQEIEDVLKVNVLVRGDLSLHRENFDFTV